jgi:hypothetical protein
MVSSIGAPELILLAAVAAALWLVFRKRAAGAARPSPPRADLREVSPRSTPPETRTPVPEKDPLLGPPAPWRISDHEGPHGFVAVVGESHYQETLRGLSVLFETIERHERTFTAKLVAEPTNLYDPNAVAVTTENGTTIGYLASEMAATFQKRLLRQPDVVRCPAQLRGGADGRSIGVVLDFAQVDV